MEEGMNTQMLSVTLDSDYRFTHANANFLTTLGYASGL
jgi:methyl-accepting chemotaxis protein